MTRVALYARYSSDRQNERSIADQLAVLSRHAEAKGWTIAGVFTDAAISGSAMANRPGLLNALQAAERGEFDLLLAEDEDRLARNLEHMAHVANRLEDVGAAIATLSSDRVEGMMIAFKGGMAQDYIRNLSQKTARGMASNAHKGLATGSRLYGYRSAPGGEMTIVEAQAEVIRRIFGQYVDGLTPREIAAGLNTDAVPGPRGGQWTASSINGSIQRANGILNTELYAGVKVYGRVEMKKDRRTGKRICIPVPPEKHLRVPVEHLRIIDDGLWAAARALKARYAGLTAAARGKLVRRPGLLTGLTRCGACGGAYTSRGSNRLVCSANREKGRSACLNGRSVRRDEIEQRVLSGLRDRLLAPEMVAAYVRAWRAEWARLAAEATESRAPVERRLAEVGRRISRLVDALADGAAVDPVRDRLAELEREKADLTARLAQLDAAPAPPVQLHPRLAETCAESVETLQRRLAEGDGAPAERRLLDSVRGLIDRVEILPEGADFQGEIRVSLHGTLARFMAADPAPHRGSALVAGGGIMRSPHTGTNPVLKIAC